MSAEKCLIADADFRMRLGPLLGFFGCCCCSLRSGIEIVPELTGAPVGCQLMRGVIVEQSLTSPPLSVAAALGAK